MADSTTINTALKFEGGIVIASDSQASDPNAGVRWPVEKVSRIGTQPIVVGFSGSYGSAERMREALDQFQFHSNMFKASHRVRNAIEGCLAPEFQRVHQKYPNIHANSDFWRITVWGLSAYWAEGDAHILELEPNGECCPHPHFHAIGSGGTTAYAIWRTLGGRELININESKAIQVTLRILRTCIDVEMWGVDEPLSIWIVRQDHVRSLSVEQIGAEKQYVDEWEKRERNNFLNG